MIKLLCGLFISLLFTNIVNAAVVDSLQNSVTVQRDRKEHSVVVGETLQQGDAIKTGPESRVWIRFHDGSIMKIGERAHLVLDQLVPPSEKKGWLEATFNLASGIFRFTSHTEQPQRAIEVKVGRGLTLGIRGTDFFAKADEHKDLVCLMSGQLEARADKTKVVLNQPHQFFIVPQGSPPLPIASISEKWLEKWVKDTELSKP
jgi:hypothetical protein